MLYDISLMVHEFRFFGESAFLGMAYIDIWSRYKTPVNDSDMLDVLISDEGLIYQISHKDMYIYG